jgi:hypothetical protein
LLLEKLEAGKLCVMTLVTIEVTWLWLFENFDISISTSTPILSNGTTAISMARDPMKHNLNKHVGVDTFYTGA